MADMSYSYVSALTEEIAAYGRRNPDTPLSTVYIGGGTPTFIEEELICRIMETVRSSLVLDKEAEVTIECNPGTAGLDKLKALREAGINRLSIGLQSADDRILKALGRIHSYSDFIDCFLSGRKAGFDNISLDLMFGLPGQTEEIWLDTLKKAVELSPEHISAYSLKIEEGTPFYQMNPRGELTGPDDDRNRDMYDRAVEFLAAKGYERYEISNFAKPGYKSRHNLLYWKCEDYAGFGAGAYSCIGGRRFSNKRGVKEYIAAVSQRGRADSQAEVSSELDFMCEFMFLGLRLDEGVSKSEFKDRFGADMEQVFAEPLNKHINMTKTLADCGDRIKIRPEFAYVSNIIMSDFIL